MSVKVFILNVCNDITQLFLQYNIRQVWLPGLVHSPPPPPPPATVW